MKKTSLGDVYECLASESGGHEVDLPEDMIQRANLPLERMLELGQR
jgi:quinolinate synthase